MSRPTPEYRRPRGESSIGPALLLLIATAVSILALVLTLTSMGDDPPQPTPSPTFTPMQLPTLSGVRS